MAMDTAAERAIAAFERLHRLTVTVHDLRGDLWHQVAPARLSHRHPLCRAVKNSPNAFRCEAFELESLRAQLASSGVGRCHVCHARLVEWVVPVRSDSGLDWVLFAGLRRAGSGLASAVRDPQPATRNVWATGTALPPTVDEGETADILEGLLALAARLEQLRRAPPQRQGRAATRGDNVAHRAARIARFIAQRHAEPIRLADLAGELGLSTDRTGREVLRLLGRGFAALVAEARLVDAATLLRTTGLPVLEVALSTGFNDLSHFHACFRRRFGTTPAGWRKAAAYS